MSARSQLADRIGRLCAELGEAGALDVVARVGAAEVLGHIISALCAKGPDLAQVEADLDAMDAMRSRHGIPPLPGTVRGYRPAIGGSGHPVVYARACPIRTCSRTAPEPAAGTEPPTCAVAGLPLCRFRLPT